MTKKYQCAYCNNIISVGDGMALEKLSQCSVCAYSGWREVDLNAGVIPACEATKTNEIRSVEAPVDKSCWIPITCEGCEEKSKAVSNLFFKLYKKGEEIVAKDAAIRGAGHTIVEQAKETERLKKELEASKEGIQVILEAFFKLEGAPRYGSYEDFAKWIEAEIVPLKKVAPYDELKPSFDMFGHVISHDPAAHTKLDVLILNLGETRALLEQWEPAKKGKKK